METPTHTTAEAAQLDHRRTRRAFGKVKVLVAAYGALRPQSSSRSPSSRSPGKR
ncbi:hypothetical protein AB0B45_38215 [Nonomuraea sp. NPDC049152]|uniref:hypothetical protein n=1 Tax=Nonomuraea sp. NPDC049152 TaxID=3154350 RepID=UPI0033E7A940